MFSVLRVYQIILGLLEHVLMLKHYTCAHGLGSRHDVFPCTIVFMLVLQGSVGDVLDISQIIFWTSGGVEFFCSRDCLSTRNFRVGGL